MNRIYKSFFTVSLISCINCFALELSSALQAHDFREARAVLEDVTKYEEQGTVKYHLLATVSQTCRWLGMIVSWEGLKSLTDYFTSTQSSSPLPLQTRSSFSQIPLTTIRITPCTNAPNITARGDVTEGNDLSHLVNMCMMSQATVEKCTVLCSDITSISRNCTFNVDKVCPKIPVHETITSSQLSSVERIAIATTAVAIICAIPAYQAHKRPASLRSLQACCRYQLIPALTMRNELEATRLVSRILDITIADINTHDSDRNSPVHLAARLKRAGILRKLRSKGAFIDAKNCFGDTPLIISAKNGDLHCVRALLLSLNDYPPEPADVNRTNKQGRTALIEAARNGHQDIVSDLLLANALVNHQDHSKMTALDHTIQAQPPNLVDITRMLGNHGATIDQRTHDLLQHIPNNHGIISSLFQRFRGLFR